DMDGQACAINYENGIENMILSVNVNDLQGEKAVWIFPVPAKPEDTKIDIIKEFPDFYGYDVESRAKKDISYNFALMKLSQIYTIFFPSVGMSWYQKNYIAMSASGPKSGEVQIHTSIEKNGLTTELVTAKNSNSLYDYLTDKEAGMPPEFISVLDEYIGKEYSFVISWISDVEEFKKSQPKAYIKDVLEEKNTIEEIKETLEYFINKTEIKETKRFQMALDNINNELRSYELYTDPIIKKNETNTFKIKMKDSIVAYNNMAFNYKYAIRIYLSFPTDKIYFPLKTTSIYGDTKIPMLVYVTNYIEPEIYEEIEKDTQVTYFNDKKYDMPDELKSFFNGKIAFEELEYTRIKINAPSNNLIDDLWMDDSVPTKLVLIENIENNMNILRFILFIICLCLASMISGMMVFGKDKPNKKNFALFGLYNFFSLMGFAIAAYVAKIDEKFTQLKEENAKPRDLKKPVLATLAIVYIPSFLFFTREIGSELFFGVIAIMCILPSSLIFPFIYGFYNNRKILKFIILFSIIFLILIYILQAGLGFIL
ncbi:MAG: hypothetical protein KAQ92_05515, partial [Candidatus Aenigmarchaeota archaeon]|nr:hypothetical protein [Candidatus Aenigmarchaeota archaeon]